MQYQPFVFRSSTKQSPIFAGRFDILPLRMAFRPTPLSCRSLPMQIAHGLDSPLGMIKRLLKKEDGLRAPPPTMETYTEAVNKCIKSATTFMEHAHAFAEAKRGYKLWQKEIELIRVRKEIDALKLVLPLLVEEEDACQIENTLGGDFVENLLAEEESRF